MASLWLYFNNNITIFRNIFKLRLKLPRNSKFIQGTDSGHSIGTTVEAGLPNITGGLIDVTGGENLNSSGAFDLVGDYTYLLQSGSSGKGGSFGFNASRSSSIYGNSTTVQPPAICMYLEFYLN